MLTKGLSLQNASLQLKLQLLVLCTCGKQSHIFSKINGKFFVYVSKTEVENTLSNMLSSISFPTLNSTAWSNYFSCPWPPQELKEMLDLNLRPFWAVVFMKCYPRDFCFKEWTPAMSHSHHREHGGLKGKDLGDHQPAAAAPPTDHWYYPFGKW